MKWLITRSVAAQGASILGRFARWWFHELVGCVPASWRERSTRRIEAQLGDGFVALKIYRSTGRAIEGRAHFSCGTVEPRDFAGQLARERRSLPVWLVPPPAAILSRIVQVPRSAVAHFDKLLAVEADRWTPFGPDEITAAWRALQSSGSHKSDIELRFVPRSSIERWSELLAPFGLVPSLVVLSDDRRFSAPVTASAPRFGQRRRLAAAALATALLLLFFADWAASVRERNAWQARVDSERRLLARQREMERRIEDILAASHETEKPRAALLASLSAVLPPADWLTEISLRQGTATLRGYSANVESLLKALEPLSSDSVVTIQGEPTFDARLERQRFSVAFHIVEASQR